MQAVGTPSLAFAFMQYRKPWGGRGCDSLMDSFPPFLFPMLRLQERLQNANGGVKFWKAKKKLFQNARGRLQMNRI